MLSLTALVVQGEARARVCRWVYPGYEEDSGMETGGQE